MAIGDIYYAKWKFADTALGTIYTPGIHIRQDGASFDANNAADVLISVWNDVVTTEAIKAFYKTTTRLEAILIRRVDPLEPIEQTITTGLPIAGTHTGEQLYASTAILFSFRTAKIGRSYRGRCYFPAPVENKEDSDGALSVAGATTLIDSMNLLDDLGAIGQLTPQVVYSPKLGTADEVTLRKVDRRFRTQRRRQIENPLYVE